MAENRKAGDTMKRDLQADLAWVNDPDVCLSQRVREICDHAIHRAMEAEAENASLREQLEQAQAEAAAMREALESIANHPGIVMGWIRDIARQPLSTDAGRDYLNGGR